MNDVIEQMKRVLPVLERLEADPALWIKLTAGTGVATLNGYRNALAKAEEASQLKACNTCRSTGKMCRKLALGMGCLDYKPKYG
jgi:hypothetical protein